MKDMDNQLNSIVIPTGYNDIMWYIIFYSFSHYFSIDKT